MSGNDYKTGCHPDLLVDFAAGRLERLEQDAIAEHLKRCSQCSRKLKQLHEFEKGLQATRTIEMKADASEEIWNNLQQYVQQSQQELHVRNAWRTILSRPSTFAVAASILFLIPGIWLLIHFLGPMAADPSARPGEAVVTAQNETTPRTFPVGAVASFGPEARATVREADRKSGIVFLERGQVNVSVQKLTEHRRFEVHTEDAIVRVKGTRFEVDKHSDDMTRVEVFEGTVWVNPIGRNREQIVLKAGDSAEIPSLAAYLWELREAGENALNVKAFAEATSYFKRYLNTSETGDASEVEFLLAEALERSGNDTEAVHMYLDMTRSSVSLRAENAYAALVSLQMRLKNNTEVRKTWKQYLNRFPQGNFSQDALRWLAEDECHSTPGTFYRQYQKRYGKTNQGRQLKQQCMTIGE